MTKRQLRSVDLWKGLTILAVLNAQTIFAARSLDLPKWLQSAALLIDVPVFFFIAGYVLHSADRKGIANRGLRQVARLVVDYAVVGVVAFMIATVWRSASGLDSVPDLGETIGSFFAIRPQGVLWSMWPAFGQSLGFVRAYLSILPLAIVAMCLPMRGKRMLFLLLSLSTFLLISEYCPDAPPFILSDARSVSFYLTLFLAGAVFKRMRDHFSIVNMLLVWLGLAAATMLACFEAGGLPDLDAAKSLPSSVYLLFSSHSIMAFCLMAILEQRGLISLATSRTIQGLSWCGHSAMRIHLWQGLVVTVSTLAILEMLERGWHPVAICALALTWNIGASISLAACHNWIEIAIMNLSQSRRERYTRTTRVTMRTRRKSQDQDHTAVSE